MSGGDLRDLEGPLCSLLSFATMANDYLERLDLPNAKKIGDDSFQFTLSMGELNAIAFATGEILRRVSEIDAAYHAAYGSIDPAAKS